MPNDLVSPVNRIELTSSGQAPSAQPVQAHPVENNSQLQANAAAQQTAAQQTQTQNKVKAHTAPASDQQADSKALVNSTNKSDVHMMFRVDAKTKEVSVLMVDKVTKKVVRTIPPEEIKKMNAGDLVELLA